MAIKKTTAKAEEKKTTTAAKATETETKTAAKATATKTEAKPATKTAAKTATKTATKTTKTTATKTAAKTEEKAAPAKKPAAKRATKTDVKVYVEFNGVKVAVDEMVENVKATYAAQGGKDAVKTLEVYVKPDENVAYFVVNGELEGNKMDVYFC